MAKILNLTPSDIPVTVDDGSVIVLPAKKTIETSTVNADKILTLLGKDNVKLIIEEREVEVIVNPLVLDDVVIMAETKKKKKK